MRFGQWVGRVRRANGVGRVGLGDDAFLVHVDGLPTAVRVARQRVGLTWRLGALTEVALKGIADATVGLADVNRAVALHAVGRYGAQQIPLRDLPRTRQRLHGIHRAREADHADRRGRPGWSTEHGQRATLGPNRNQQAEHEGQPYDDQAVQAIPLAKAGRAGRIGTLGRIGIRAHARVFWKAASYITIPAQNCCRIRRAALRRPPNFGRITQR